MGSSADQVPVEGQNAARSVFQLAEALHRKPVSEEEVKKSAGWITSLLDVLNAPLADIIRYTTPLRSVADGIITLYAAKNGLLPPSANAAALICQSAYLESLREIIVLTDGDSFLEKIDDSAATNEEKDRIRKLGLFTLDNEDETSLLESFPNTDLASEFNQILTMRLTRVGMPPPEAQRLTFRVAANTGKHIIGAVSESDGLSDLLGERFRFDVASTNAKYTDYDRYLRERILGGPLEPVFTESVPIKDIYIPFSAKPVDYNWRIISDAQSVDPIRWVESMLQSNEQHNKAACVLGPPGRGKTTFCRMLADRILKNQHPIWTPLRIRFKDIRKIHDSFSRNLAAAVGAGFFGSDFEWLNDENHRFLFIIDGFDDPGLRNSDAYSTNDFLEEICAFQQTCDRNPNMGHRCLITGHSAPLERLRFNPPCLDCIEILPFDDRQKKLWLDRRLGLTQKSYSEGFQDLLTDAQQPTGLTGIAGEPLFLYLLTVVQGDIDLKTEDWEDNEGDTDLKIRVLEKALEWVEYRLLGGHSHESELEQIEELRSFLEESGLRAMQSETGDIPLNAVKDGFLISEPEPANDEGDPTSPEDDRREMLRLPLFLRSHSSPNGETAAFTHPSFRHFFAAKRLFRAMVRWSRSSFAVSDPYPVSNETVPEEIYDFLGLGDLHDEVIVFLFALLKKNDRLQLRWIFEQLDAFYSLWCKGLFIDAAAENSPLLKKVRSATASGMNANQRLVDIQTGLNVMRLLLELNRAIEPPEDEFAKIAFHPCGRADLGNFDPDRLLRTIGYCQAIGADTFIKAVGPYLSAVDLSNAELTNCILRGVDFKGADLSNADLSGADLRSSDLGGADLRSAVLVGANLRLANLSATNANRVNFKSANLRGANVIGAGLSDADLHNANLKLADLRLADLRDSNLSGANLTYANLGNANLTGANLNNANLGAANLTRTNLTEALLQGAALRGAEIRFANLTRADLDATDLRNASLQHTILDHAHLGGAILKGADLRGAVLTDANLQVADLRNADLRGGRPSKCGIEQRLPGGHHLGQPDAVRRGEASQERPHASSEAAVQARIRLADGFGP